MMRELETVTSVTSVTIARGWGGPESYERLDVRSTLHSLSR